MSKGPRGHEGAQGWPGDENFPQWAIDIILFRHEQYEDAIWEAEHSSGMICIEAVNEKYKKIDKAISKMVQFVNNNNFKPYLMDESHKGL